MVLGPLLFAVEFPLLALSTVFVAFRFYCRHFIVRNLGPDDWIMLVALLNAWGIGVLNTFQVKYGSGTHMMDLPSTPGLFVGTLKVWYIYQMLYLITLFFVKMSILAFYRRLSPAQGYHLAIKITAGAVTVFTIAMVFVNAFECPKKPSLAWAPTFPMGCNNLVPVYYAQAGFNILSDIVILLLPLPSLLRLQVNKRKRVALILVFSIGGVAVIASIVRINALYIFQHSTDIPYDGIFILIWSQVEINVAIISASAPSLRPLVKSLLGGTTTTSSSNPKSTSYYNRKNRIPLQSFSGPGRDAEIITNVSGRGAGLGNESEEHIVAKAGGIVRTTDVTVEVVDEERGRRGPWGKL
ncbi:uncharacterized protein LAJ45_05083 [Morchella importuna]|uniref:Rhodopsin domain-containing protein n=1 Tax=Morchella conica CCBAS932 TaxID=1392247 RepID=A0A3N4KXW9_9PEZI|nr:uncharacterized protein LAJ45_05083 [Morchella importuna]KAH8150901.1 hypothetical protein LAJ45_05083 [Morchella importuna]RPB14092.1 hypothetical protein P167DRAFT_534316 [Morchella conica CCBAS932]